MPQISNWAVSTERSARSVKNSRQTKVKEWYYTERPSIKVAVHYIDGEYVVKENVMNVGGRMAVRATTDTLNSALSRATSFMRQHTRM